MGNPPPPLVALPLASPGAISRAIWAKTPDAKRKVFSTTEMRTYGLVMQGNNLDPGTLVVTSSVSTGASEPKCFLTLRMNSATTAIPKIELIHYVGSYLVALGQPGNLHGHTFEPLSESRLKTS